ncbi:MAG: permease prefix domain 1-containing protein [Gaiellales bacterium]
MTETLLDGFLDDLERALHDLRRGERRRALREARDHVLCAAAERESDGYTRAESLRGAIASFGSVDTIAAGYRAAGARNGVTAASGVLVGAVVLAALTILPVGGGLGQVFISTSNAADGGCTGRWNERPPSALYPLAWVSSPGPACAVVLHDARHAIVYRQDARGAGWYVVRPAGRQAFTVRNLPAHFRAHGYRVVDDGQIVGRVLPAAG